MKPVCAVWVVTYNQEKYIGQTLEGIINQRTDFPFKIFVGDDCSTDSTREICLDYKNRYPELIELIFNERNNMQQNSANIYKACFNSGAKYTAMCEGDDYWNDQYKLQTQMKFLEENETYVGCFHNTEERYENDDNRASFLYCNYSKAQEISFKDLTLSNRIPTCSVVFRNNLFGDFPSWYKDLRVGDWTLHLLNAQFGDFWYIPKIMAVHRLHIKGIWMLQDPNINNMHVIKAYDALISEFQKKPLLQQHLVKAKSIFISNVSSGDVKIGYKQRFKKKVINLINKI